jgi:hypothetical protein
VSLIDLDRPAEPSAGRARPRPGWRPTRGVLIALLVGAVVGGLFTYRVTVQQRRGADGRTASVLLFADTRASEIGVIVVDSAGPDRPRQVTFHAAIAVVNAGPRPLGVGSLTGQKAGMTLAGSGGWHSVAPGTSSLVDVDVTATCIARQSGGGMSLTVGGGTIPSVVSVETGSGSVESLPPIDLDTTAWAGQWQGASEKCLETWPRGSGF